MSNANENEDTLANWSPRKQESPYLYGSEWPKFEVPDFHWRMVPNLAWQLGKAYGKLYEHHYEEIGVWGHSLADLQLGAFLIFENNYLKVSINS